jgi:TonB family protein
MKRIPQSFFLALFVFAIPSFAQTQPRQTAPEELWKEFSSTAGRFKVALPGDRSETSKILESSLGKIKCHTFSSWTPFASFIVSYSELPVILTEPGQVKEFLDHMHEGEASQGKLLSMTEIELDGYPGREFIVELPDSMFRMRYYLVGPRFYQIAVRTINTAEMARSMVEMTDEFFASFKLSGKPVNNAPAVGEKGKAAVVKKVIQGSALKKVSPAYSEEAKAAGVSGEVQVEVTISEEGRVIEAIIISGPELLRDAALQAAKQWVFKPTKLDGAPVKVRGILTFNFDLQ